MAEQPAERSSQHAARRTIYEVARRAGVSAATVSRYLNRSGYVGAASRERIAEAVQALEYQPSPAARALAGRRSGLVMLAVPGIANPQWGEVAQALEACLRKQGLGLLLVNLAGGRDHELAAIEQAHRIRADGLAISMLHWRPGDFRKLQRAGCHIVSLSRDIDDPALDAVLPDRPTAIRLAYQHLAGLGHRRIALVHGAGGQVAYPSRLTAYQAARREAEHDVEPVLEVVVPEPTLAAGQVAAADLRRRAATAAIASGDNLAIGLWLGLEQAGLRVPCDCSVVGMDDIEAAALVRSGLTTVALDRAERGRLVARLLIDRIQGRRDDAPCRLYIQPRLVIRASTAPPARHAADEPPRSHVA